MKTLAGLYSNLSWLTIRSELSQSHWQHRVPRTPQEVTTSTCVWNEAAHDGAFQHCVKIHSFIDLLVSEPKLAPTSKQGHWFRHPLPTPGEHLFQILLSPETRSGFSYQLLACLWVTERVFSRRQGGLPVSPMRLSWGLMSTAVKAFAPIGL